MDLGAKSWKSGEVVAGQFPAGMKVLVVDDDPTCLRILEKMLKNCLYEVTTCNRAEVALNFLRDNRNGCDIVISDVHMPDMDGFKLLEHVGLEMDLPVIMMSADDSKHVVMKGVTHGACDYLIKPVRIEALKNIWQHVVRKKKHEWKDKDFEHSGSVEEGQQKPLEEVDCSSSVNEGNWKNSKKRKDEEDEGEDRDDTSTLKKPRVVWSVELHQQFVIAVNQLGIDKAVPKKILELMNVPGLTRENVASHLQKYRLYLRRLSGVSHHQNGLGNSFLGSSEPFGPLSSLNGVDLQALAASGQIPPQSLASIQAAALGRTASKSTLPSLPLVEQRNVFSFENPKPRFVEGQQQQNDNSKQPSLLHGIPTTMDSKQLANLHRHVHSQTSQSNSLMMQMVQSQSRTQILNEYIGSHGSNIPSHVIPNAVLGQNRIENNRGPQYTSMSQPSTSAECSGNGFPLPSTDMKGSRGLPHNYDVLNNLNQNRNEDWRLHNVGSTFTLPPSVLMEQHTSSNGQQMNFSTSNKPSTNMSERLPEMGFKNGLFPGRFGQEDLMSALLKQQEGVGAVESEFGFDGYHLDNLPV